LTVQERDRGGRQHTRDADRREPRPALHLPGEPAEAPGFGAAPPLRTDLGADRRQQRGDDGEGRGQRHDPLSNKAAAAQLFVSPRTIDFHLRNVFSKLQVSSRAELMALPLDL
jgi:hypothetical protein